MEKLKYNATINKNKRKSLIKNRIYEQQIDQEASLKDHMDVAIRMYIGYVFVWRK